MSLNLLLVVFSFVIGIVVTSAIRSLDIHEKEPLSKMLFVLLWGGFWSVAIAIVTYGVLDKANIGDLHTFFGAIFVIGPVEETAKLLALLSSYFFIKKEMNEPTDGLVYMTCVALGFSLVENYFYATRTPDSGYLLLLRLFISTPSHILFSVFMGIAFYIVVKHRVGFILLAGSLLYASLIHGLYDAILFNGWVLAVLMLLMGLTWKWAVSTLSYTTATSPFRKDLKEFVEDYGQAEIMDGLECLHCGSTSRKKTFELNKITLQKCDQCPSYVTTKESLFEIFHFFGSSFRDLTGHYWDGKFYEKDYSTLYKGNFVSDEKNLAYFFLDELNEALTAFNRTIIDSFEEKWWFPAKLRRRQHPKKASAGNAILVATFLTVILFCLGVVIVGQEIALGVGIIFLPVIIIFFGLSYAILSSIIERR